MAFISVSGEPGSPQEELAAAIARDLGAELVSGSVLRQHLEAEFGDVRIPDKALKYGVRSLVARLGTRSHVVLCAPKAEAVVRELPRSLRVYVFHERGGKPRDFDLILNGNTLDCSQVALVVVRAAEAMGILGGGLLSAAEESQVQFRVRLQLAKYGIAPVLGPQAARKEFNHPSEQIFANLLDFYRIRWDYEPRSFPLQWDKDGNVLEAFTPDFYLPEFDLYVELTTMKQSLVTRKNRKVRLLRAIYPHVNIQVFYQKDFQDLVSKYGLADRVSE